MTYIIIGVIVIALASYFIFFKQKQSTITENKEEINTKREDEEINTKKEDEDFPPKPKWKPNLPIDIELIYEKAKYYTGDKLQFAVFQNGTVAFFGKPVDNIEDSAKAALDKIYNAHPDFKPILMDDGNYLIQYSQPAFTIVFKDEIENNWQYIESNHMDGICRAEVLLNVKGERNVFDSVGKFCLYARAKMFMDAQAPNIVKTFQPSTN